MELDEQERRGFMKDEYLMLQDQYEDFDRRSLTIKGWIATGAVAGLAISFGSSNKYVYVVPVLVAAMTGVFWYLESYWKLFQYALGDRIRVIEADFRDDPDILVKKPVPFQTYNHWYRSYSLDEPLYEYERQSYHGAIGRPAKRSIRLRQVALQRFVCLPYLIVIILSLGSFTMLLLANR